MNDEFKFINSITPNKTYQRSLVKGIGDDAALYQGDSRFDEIICMDTMVEGIHFIRKTMKPYHIGYKALAANISDIAAMGGVPTYYLVSIAIPSGWCEEELRDIYAGMNDLGSHFKMDLIGGDTVSTKSDLVLSVTVLGRIEQGKRLLRSNARPGDIVFITGHVGDSAAGLDLLLNNGINYQYTDLEQKLIRAHQLPFPQTEEGRLLAQSHVRIALNDISDGVASEAHEIAEASKVSLILDEWCLPKSRAMGLFSENRQLDWMLNGGEDFKLIGTVSIDHWQMLKQQFSSHNLQIFKVGKVNDGPARVLLNRERNTIEIKKAGYNHFNREES